MPGAGGRAVHCGIGIEDGARSIERRLRHRRAALGRSLGTRISGGSTSPKAPFNSPRVPRKPARAPPRPAADAGRPMPEMSRPRNRRRSAIERLEALNCSRIISMSAINGRQRIVLPGPWARPAPRWSNRTVERRSSSSSPMIGLAAAAGYRADRPPHSSARPTVSTCRFRWLLAGNSCEVSGARP